jgi:very-short-patch-repair endonuclease
MTKIYNQTKLKQRRKKLRKEATPAERIFWSKIRCKRIGYKFRRQYSIGNYIADFYCPELRLVIEIDGGQHFETDRLTNDLLRTEYLNSLGIKVKRYTNVEIRKNLISVVDDLMSLCKGLDER